MVIVGVDCSESHGIEGRARVKLGESVSGTKNGNGDGNGDGNGSGDDRCLSPGLMLTDSRAQAL